MAGIILNLKTDTIGHADYITELYYDKEAGTTYARRWTDPTGTGVIDTQQTSVIFEDVKNLWEAGTLLWKRDVTAAAGKRKIYTSQFTGTAPVTINAKLYTGITHTFLTGNFSSNAVNPTPAPVLPTLTIAHSSGLICRP